MNSGSIHSLSPLFMYFKQAFMPYWNFELTWDVTLHCGKVGGGVDQGLATEVTHFRLSQPSSN